MSSEVGSRASRAHSLVDSLLDVDTPIGGHGVMLTGNAKSLLVMFALFSTITASQYAAAIIANSLALKADCASMLVDALSYLANLAAECTRNPARKVVLQLAMSAVSLVLLVGFTVYFIVESVGNIHATAGDDDDDVNPYIVLGFALAGLLFDVASLLAYKVWSKDDKAADAPANDLEESLDPSSGEKKKKDVNMLSALMHVLSDLARSTTTLVESIILLAYPNINGVAVDGWSALIVCSLIAGGAVFAIGTWALELKRHCSSQPHDDCTIVTNHGGRLDASALPTAGRVQESHSSTRA